MKTYRAHTCGQLHPSHAEQTILLSGWVRRIREHGRLRFIYLLNHYGITQIVAGKTRTLPIGRSESSHPY